MVYAYDQWAQMPVKDLYDSQMMAIIINAAKDQYDKAEARMKEFDKEYGDFVSPFQKDMDLYGSTIGRIKDIVNNADIRTQEGRAAIQRAVNSVDPRLYNQMRANAKMGYAYQDTLQKLAAQGKFDKDMNDWWLRNKLGVGSFEDFSTAGSNGALNSWNVSSPIQAATLQQLTDDLYKGLDARDLSAAEAKAALGDAYDPRAKYTGNTFGDLLKVAREGVPGLTGDPRLDYFREMSKQTALARNPNASAAEIENQFQRDVANANIRYLKGPKGDLDNWYKEQTLRAARAAAAAKKNPLNDYPMWTRRQMASVQHQRSLSNIENIEKLIRSGKYPGGLRAAMNAYYQANTYRPKQGDLLTALKIAANNADPETVREGYSKKRMPVTFDGGVSLQLNRQYAYMNSIKGYRGVYSKTKTAEKLENWLNDHRTAGYIPDNDVSVTHGYDGVDVLDINFPVRVNKSVIDDFFRSNYNTEGFTDDKAKRICASLGIVGRTTEGKTVSLASGKVKWDDIEEVDIPASRTNSDIGYSFAEIDMDDAATQLTKTLAQKAIAGQ